MLFEHRLEFDEELCFCFVIVEKTFVRVNWTNLFEVDKNNRSSLERHKTHHDKYAYYLLILFSIYAEMVMIKATEDVEEGVRVGVTMLKDVKFDEW